ncbi:MAG: hypothetical protein AB7P16_29020 [Bradyrhizobium sp.]|uniref:hypothetical protein n=1 Tax=Bradyrhizobium sp. TaxID=376 RepID=UPI003D0F52C2
MIRLVLIAFLSLVSAPALAGFFDGYPAVLPGDAETLADAHDLETRAYGQWLTIRVEPTYSLASGMTAIDFRDGLKAAMIDINDTLPAVTQTPTLIDTVGGWQRYNDAKRTDEFWSNRLYYRTPAPGTWKQPVLVINDGMGAYYSTGILPPRYTGENVAQILHAAGHPVLVMALKGFDDKYFRPAWGVHGVFRFDAYAKQRGTTAASIWLQDAIDAVGLLKQWHAGPIGVTGVSKSANIAAAVALISDDVDRAYLASGHSMYEDQFGSSNAWGYAVGERLHYSRVSVLAALWDKAVRLSYSTNDDVSYRVEAIEGRVLNAVNTVRIAWGKPQLSQLSAAPSHYYDAADVAAFFN